MELRISSVVFGLAAVGFAFCYPDCGSVDGTLVSVTIPGCENENVRCVLRRNTNASVTIEFNTLEDVSKLTAVVHGTVLGVEVPFPLPNPDACKESGLECPLAKGGPYKYQMSLPVLKKYPRVTVDIKMELKDDTNKDVICVKIPAKIQ